MTSNALVSVKKLTRIFDVSKPWLNRMVERLPKAMLTAVSDVTFDIPERAGLRSGRRKRVRENPPSARWLWGC